MSLFIARTSVSNVLENMLLRSLERCASECIAGEGFERMEPTLPACLVDEEEHAVSARTAEDAMMVAAALSAVRLVMVIGGCPLSL